jgi:DNA-binding NarL/FixJ family response regulator
MGTCDIMIVDDDPEFLSRCCRIVASDPALRLVGAFPDGTSAKHALAAIQPDVLLVDLGLPDMNGVELIRESARRYPDTEILVITMFGDEAHVLASIEAGATGYLLKDALPTEFIGLINELRAGGSPISPIIARQLLKRFRPPTPPSADVSLSEREHEVLALTAKGFSFAEIARLLDISPHTVTSHVKKIYQKLSVHSRGEAVYEANRMGLI